ncbi:DUF3846 domain-containing protein [Arthrobacter cryoconiti]|uniref:DUF3846 domain-containing protein n=1 Tax=Arthrobacter cryoconiti TaxID=748907 RepID=A0ABV8R762_9MICC|nr:DUF3846 domain-containing protein [Arthrobacter cryoconiti]MCC9069324.1 DUF3846 domain-containing protein [Arthrobacter cryoconiti]
MSLIKVLIIPASPLEPATATDIEAGLVSLQSQVGGYIESVPGGDFNGASADSWCAYVNEEGKVLNLPVNVRATAIMHSIEKIHPWDTINGPMVVVGVDGDGESVDAPEELTAGRLLEILNKAA